MDSASCSVLAGSAFSAKRYIDPVERVQVIEVDHMVLHILAGADDVADQVGILWNLDAERIFDGAHRRQRVNRRAHAADPLRPDPGFARIAAAQDQFNPTKHGS